MHVNSAAISFMLRIANAQSLQSKITATVEYLHDQYLEADHHGEAELKLCSVVLKFAEDMSLNAHKNIVVVSVDSDACYHNVAVPRWEYTHQLITSSSVKGTFLELARS